MVLDLSGAADEVVKRYALDQLPLDRRTRTSADLLRLDGKLALVTGGGGDGLGAAICERLAEQGADIAVLDVSETAAATTVTSLAERWNLRAEQLLADVADREQVGTAVDGLLERKGRIDILVNNAGGSGSIGLDGGKPKQHGPFDQMEIEDLLTVVRVNLVGLLMVTRLVLPHMLARGSGRIINVASEGGKTAIPDLSVYNACKAGVIGFTRSLAADVGSRGVTVAGVCPGIMVSDRTLRSLSDPAGRGFTSLDTAFSRVTLGRCTVVDEVAGVIAFLASEAGSFVHGTSVSLGGGMAD